MKYTLSDEQVALGETVRAMFSKSATPAWQRSLWVTETGRDEQAWSSLAELGLIAIALPEEADGLGGTITDLIPFFEAVGEYAYPDAVVEGVLTAPLAIHWGGNEAQQSLLQSIMSGEHRATIALREGSLVPDAHVSDFIILPKGAELWLFRRDELTLTRQYVEDPARRLYECVPVSNKVGERLPGAQERVVDLVALEQLATAAILNGISSRVIDMAIEYSLQRTQFGRPVGSFQAVKHMLADAYSRLHLASVATRAAAGSQSKIDTSEAAMARLVSGEAEFIANRVALQVHGGIGFTFEHDLHIWLKRGKALEQLQGGPNHIAAEIGMEVLSVH